MAANFRETVGRAIKIAIVNEGITQRQLASDLKETPQMVNKWANGGAMSTKKLEKIVNHFDMKLSEFIALGER